MINVHLGNRFKIYINVYAKIQLVCLCDERRRHRFSLLVKSFHDDENVHLQY